MSKRFDSEIGVKSIAGFAIGLLVVLVLSGVGLWYFSKILRAYKVSQDPPPPALEAARAVYEPPGPRLQDDPEGELEALREQEDAILEGYAWEDEANGIARVPIERAITLLVGDERPPAIETAAPGARDAQEAHH